MADSPRLHARYESLADTFAGHFPEKLSGPRTVGREAEFPVVDQTGQAADVARLWPLLAGPALQEKRDAVNENLIVGLAGAAYQYALEVGRGTIELNVGPCATLFQLAALFQAGLNRLVQAADALGWRVLGYGVQPRTPPGTGLLSPKQRYIALAEAMGDEWLWYTVTASDQAHVDIARAEAVPVLNFGHLMTPVVVALCSNSPVVAGRASGYCSSREGRMTHAVHGGRHGMIARPYASLLDFVQRLGRLPYLLRREGAALLPDGRRFADVLLAEWPDEDEFGADRAGFQAFLLHDHYVWHSARLRTAYATVELRPACQQPPHQPMAAAALYLGLIEGHREIDAFVQDALGPRYWARMKAYHRLVISDGLAALEPLPGFVERIVQLAEAALARRGWGEEKLLAPVWQRLAQRENPAQAALAVFRAQGLAGLIESVRMEQGQAESAETAPG